MPDAEDLGCASLAIGADDVITDVEGTSAAPSHLHAYCKCHPSSSCYKDKSYQKFSTTSDLVRLLNLFDPVLSIQSSSVLARPMTVHLLQHFRCPQFGHLFPARANDHILSPREISKS